MRVLLSPQASRQLSARRMASSGRVGTRLLLLLATAQRCAAGYTMDQAMAIHPDGTPVDPAAMRDHMRKGDLPTHWMEDLKLLELVAGDDLDAFADYMETINSDRIFQEDGSAQDIKAWRQSVRDDEHFSGLMRGSYPEELELIFSGSDDEVQNMLRAQHSAQAAAMEQESKYEEEL